MTLALFSSSCTWKYLAQLGAFAKPHLEPVIKAPLPILASHFCLNERVGIVAGGALLALMSAGLVAGAALDCLSCKPQKAPIKIISAALLGALPAGLFLVNTLK